MCEYGRGHKRNEAVEFLIHHVAGKEMPSKEGIRLAKEAGISKRTLDRARIAVNAKSRKTVNSGWLISVDE